MEAKEKDQQEKKSSEPVFFTGQTMKDISPLKKPATDAADPAETGLAGDDDTPGDAEPTEKKRSPSAKVKQPIEKLEEGDGDEPELEDEFEPIIKKYGGDQRKMAAAIKAYQRTANEKSREAKRLQQLALSQRQYAPQQHVALQTDPKTASAVDTDEIEVADSDLEVLLNDLSDSTKAKDGLKKLLKQSREEGRKAYRKDRERELAIERQRQAQEAEQANVAVLYHRAKSILRDRAEAEGDQDAYELYSNEKYKATEEDYLEAYDEIEKEFSYIAQNIPPRDGRLKLEQFEFARSQLDPRTYAERLTTQARAKTLREAQQVSPGRKVLIPQAGGSFGHRATKKLSAKSLPKDRTAAFEALWNGQLSDAEIEDLENQLIAGK